MKTPLGKRGRTWGGVGGGKRRLELGGVRGLEENAEIGKGFQGRLKMGWKIGERRE